MEQISEYINQLSIFFDSFEYLKIASDKSGVKSALLVILAAIIIISILVISFGAPILCDLVGTLYPTYMSYRAIETPKPDDDKQWLTYWVVYASTKIMDATQATLFFWIPFYDIFKLVFLVFLMYPKTMGATQIYNSLLAPMLSKADAKLSEVVNEVEKKVK